MLLILYTILAVTRTQTGGSQQTIQLPNPLQTESFSELLGRILNWLIAISGPIVVLMIIWSAFQLLTAAGNPEQLTKARRTILYAVIGFAVVLTARGILFIIADILGVQQ